MVRDVRAFADHMGWRTWTFEELVALGHAKDTGLRGVTVSVHPECESVHFHVDDSGRFINHGYHAYLHDPEQRQMFIEMMQENAQFMRTGMVGERPEPIASFASLDDFLAKGSTYNWSKTQFAGPAAHIQVCALLRFVRDRFAPELEIKDDTGYFEHGRLEVLTGQMAQIEQMIHLFQRAADRISSEGGASDMAGLGASDMAGLIEKLERYVNEERKMLH